MSPAGQDVWVHIEHLRGKVAGHTYELLGKGREIADALGGQLIAVLVGNEVQPLAETLAADGVLYVEDAGLAEYTPGSHAAVIRALVEKEAPRVVLFGATSMGMDLAAVLAAVLERPLIVNCVNLQVRDGRTVATSQMCGGKLLCEAEASGPVVVTVMPGSFPSEAGLAKSPPPVEVVPMPAPLEAVGMRAIRILEPEPGDVDITKSAVLVAVGRGIQRQDNIPLAEELAGALGGTVCASRPVVDQGWLPMSRQVGKSGMIVKPKLYLALGISGAPEHAEGMKDSDLIIAVNSDAKAPIFDIADYGIVIDMYDLLPALTQALRGRRA
ncbi:MAG: electron transfer flavoprotein subunit alpha/FixB family protein [Armatimonadetes bacterium]|nr:electron transfer flavoprotein subunit alpha/FixB family protein [Armatimonadota bacterium]